MKRRPRLGEVDREEESQPQPSERVNTLSGSSTPGFKLLKLLICKTGVRAAHLPQDPKDSARCWGKEPRAGHEASAH